ncbi:MauE/DoxX family redox-associated membrane protein [Geomonas sp.]|uniref:MauE/DoxX family redox-associated membrane protein n=1 Tax=Geomonas sp. TaxID=2651584 RepID=UPI002B48F429|nr:MauE/DoxX family redox-associated membrane protein [Geomonas sp.]HJV33906.1 MauE/DoxX family redox-associated membrane protein [Geomonas sp.]
MSRAKRHIPAAVRIALGGIFIYAALVKIADPVGFAGSIAAYKILPYFASYLTAATLPFLELICGVLLVVGYRVKGGAVIIGLLNLVFIGALASAIARGLDIDCGCFKQGGAKTSPWLALLRDLVFLAMAAVVLKTEHRKGISSPPPSALAEGEG